MNVDYYFHMAGKEDSPWQLSFAWEGSQFGAVKQPQQLSIHDVKHGGGVSGVLCFCLNDTYSCQIIILFLIY